MDVVHNFIRPACLFLELALPPAFQAWPFRKKVILILRVSIHFGGIFPATCAVMPFDEKCAQYSHMPKLMVSRFNHFLHCDA